MLLVIVAVRLSYLVLWHPSMSGVVASGGAWADWVAEGFDFFITELFTPCPPGYWTLERRYELEFYMNSIHP